MMKEIDFNDYPNFTRDELKCKYTDECEMHPLTMSVLQGLRYGIAKPIFISSGYRSVKHPVEADKDKPGEHTMGMAVDIICSGSTAIELINLACELGIRRIGVHQKGSPDGRFIHIGVADKFDLSFPVAIWTY